MSFKDFLVKYGLIIVAGLMVGSILLPGIFRFDIDSEWIRISWMYFRFGIDWTTTLQVFTLFFFQFDEMLLNIAIGLSAVFVIAGSGLLFASSFTTSLAMLTKIFRSIGLGAVCFGFFSCILSTCTIAETYFPLWINIEGLMHYAQNIPTIGLYFGIAGICLGGLIMKLTDWEELG